MKKKIKCSGEVIPTWKYIEEQFANPHYMKSFDDGTLDLREFLVNYIKKESDPICFTCLKSPDRCDGNI